MKKLAIVLLVLTATPVMAEDEVLIRGIKESGGFGAPVVKFTQVNGQFGVIVGGRGGWIINRSLVVGGGGYGLAGSVNAEEINSDTKLGMGYGGLELEYIFASRKVVHFSVQGLIGAGGVRYQDSDASEGDAVFIVEPSLNLVLNVTKFFRLALGAGYRYIAGVDSADLDAWALNGLSGTVALKFGYF